jgi:hypothetical protein
VLKSTTFSYIHIWDIAFDFKCGIAPKGMQEWMASISYRAMNAVSVWHMLKCLFPTSLQVAQVLHRRPPNTVIVVLGNKTDVKDWKVKPDRANAPPRRRKNLPNFEVSMKISVNVDKACLLLVWRLTGDSLIKVTKLFSLLFGQLKSGKDDSIIYTDNVIKLHPGKYKRFTLPTMIAMNVHAIIITDLSPRVRCHHSQEHETIQLQLVSHHLLNVHLRIRMTKWKYFYLWITFKIQCKLIAIALFLWISNLFWLKAWFFCRITIRKLWFKISYFTNWIIMFFKARKEKNHPLSSQIFQHEPNWCMIHDEDLEL